MIRARDLLLVELRRSPGCTTDLIERIAERYDWTISQGGASDILTTLAADRLVTRKTIAIGPRGGRPRVEYRLTPEGRGAATESRIHIAKVLRAGR